MSKTTAPRLKIIHPTLPKAEEGAAGFVKYLAAQQVALDTALRGIEENVTLNTPAAPIKRPPPTTSGGWHP